MPASPPRLCLVALLACAMASAGCGGSDEASPEEFAQRADRICREVEREFGEIQREAPQTAPQAERQAEALIEVSDRALDELRALEPPDSLEPAFEDYLRERERARAALEAGREAAAENDPDAYAEAKRRAARGQAERLRLARALGFDVCSRPSITVGGS